MSAKIGVLESHQNHSESPARRVKKTVALTLVRKALAEWVNKAVIRMRSPMSYVPELARSARIVQVQQSFDYDYPDYLFADIPKRTFWRQPLLLTYPAKDQSSFA